MISTKRRQLPTEGGEYGPLKTGDRFPLLCGNVHSDSFNLKLSDSTKSEDRFQITGIEQLADDSSFSRDSPQFDESSGAVVGCLKSNVQQRFQPNKLDEMFEVIGKGTKLMRTINFPSVIVKHLTGILDTSKVYYIMLELEINEFKGKLPAVMFSSPYAHRKTRFAELIPLGLIKNATSLWLTPLLHRKRFRRVFRKGCCFKIKWLIPGRVVNSYQEGSWNRYDLNKKSMRGLAQELLERDISEMSLHIFKSIIPLKNRIKHEKKIRKSKSIEQRILRSSGRVNLEQMQIPVATADLKHSPIHKIELSRRGRNCEYRTRDFSRTTSSKINLNNDTKYPFDKEWLTHFDSLDKYWCTSAIC